jgi:adenylate cyclase
VRKWTAGGAIGLTAAVVVLGAQALFRAAAGGTTLTPLDAVELKTYDWRLTHTARPETARTDIALVEIDEYSLRNLQPYVGGWPWPRAVHSMLVDFLARAPARLIAYDVNFAAADTRKGFDMGGATLSGADSDQALIDSVKAAGNVILLTDATYEATSGESTGVPDAGYRLASPRVLERRIVFPPFPALVPAAAGFGQNVFALDADGVMRHTVPFVRSGASVLPSLGAAAAFKALGMQAGEVRLDGDRLVMRNRMLPLAERRVRTASGVTAYDWGLIDFRGPTLSADLKHRTYQTYSFFDLLSAEQQILDKAKPAVDPAVFRDKIVFVGTTASGLLDVFETPFANGKMPGISVHAAVADDILSNRFIAEEPDAVRAAVVLLSALSVGLLAALAPAWWAAAGTTAFVAAGAWLATDQFARGRWFNLAQPVLAAALAIFGGVAYQYVVEGREKRKMKKLFGQYVSRDVYEQLVADPSRARLGGQRREMTVLFSDIRGFTTVSEAGEPEDIVRTLNEYFTCMVEIVFRHRGTVDKFVGDMVMALFGAPLDDAEHADHAVAAALEMTRALEDLNARWRAEGRPELQIGVGINSGSMIAGNIGSDAIMSYTVIGDAVNLASRLESLNKEFATRIIISDATKARLSGGCDVRPLGEVVVKGKTTAVSIYEVVAGSGGDRLQPPAPAAQEARL